MQSLHGISPGDFVKVSKIVGLNSTTADVNGFQTTTNLLNDKVFIAGTSSGTTLYLTDPNTGATVDTAGYSLYFSGGELRRMVSTITGLTWLKNETVSVFADGKTHPDVVVNSAGVIALDYPAAVVHVGYDYDSLGKTLRPDAGAADGTSIGKLRRTYRAAFMLHRSGNLSMGPSFDKLLPVDFETFTSPQAGIAAPLYSGIARESIESEHDFEGQVCFKQNGGQPGMIQSITLMIEEND
jgi:hypothetical protein